MASRFRSIALGVGLVAVLGVGGGARAQQATPAPEPADGQAQPATDSQTDPQPTFRTGIDFVRVDVIVTGDDGRPVLDLSPEDFEVREDGQVQTIETFRLVEVSGDLEPGEQAPRRIRTTADEEVEASRDDVRVFVILLDDYHVRRGNALAVKAPLIEFVSGLGPKDLVGVMYPLTPLSDVRLTRNRQAIIRTIEAFDGRKWDYEPRNEFEYRYANYPAETVERIRNQVSLSAIRAVTTHLGGLREGRKSIVVVSEGYSNTLPPQLRDQVASLPGFMNPNRYDPFAGMDSSQEATYRAFNESDLLLDIRDAFNAANRNNASLYMLDPRGLAAFEYDLDRNINFTTDAQFLRATQDTLRILADETDGRAIVNQNDLAAGLQQMVRDSSAYYLIGYTSSEGHSDGKFHEIDVSVARRGLRVRARRGFWALTAEERVSATAPKAEGPSSAVTEALASLARPAGGRAVETWVGTERAADGRTRITFAWAPTSRTGGRDARDAAASVSLTASGARGAPYFRGDVRNGFGTNGSGPEQHVVFDADPGELMMQVSVEGRDGELVDRDVLDLVVPDFTAPEVALSTPVVLRAGNALEYRALSQAADAVPTVGREFRRTDRLLIRVASYGPGDAPPTVKAALLNRAGQPMSELAALAHGDEPGRHQVDLPLAGLAPGEYLLSITAESPEGEATQLVAFRLTS